MSDTMRSYSGRSLGSPRRSHRRFPFRSLLLLLLAGVVLYGFWVTRDTYPVVRFVPPDQKYWIAVTDIAGKRAKLAESDVLKSLSQGFDLDAFNRVLRTDVSAPEWVVNNIAGQTCLLTGNDIKEYSDILVVTKMTRVGTALERMFGFSSRVEEDYAGGLRLRRLVGQDVYYAARGRVLVVSPNRDTVIRALTLPPDVEARDRSLVRALSESGSEDLQGSVAFATDDPLGGVMEDIRFALRVDPAQAKLICRAVVRPDLEQRLAGLIGEAEPQTLLTPPDGLIVVSADFGKPVKEVWTGLGGAFGWPLMSPERWEAWQTTVPGQEPGAAQMFTAVLAQAGPGIRLSWYGNDLNEMVPVPELAGVFDAGGVSLERVYEQFPPVADDAPEWEGHVRYDDQSKRLYLPMFGGPSLKPTAIETGRSLLVSTSSEVADKLLTESPASAPLDTPGNLYVRVRPQPCIDAVAEAGRLLVDMDALKGYNRESFEGEIEKWRAKVGGIQQIEALVSIDKGELRGELTLRTGLEQTGSDTQTPDSAGGSGVQTAAR